MSVELKEGKFVQNLLLADDEVITQDGDGENYLCNRLAYTKDRGNGAYI